MQPKLVSVQPFTVSGISVRTVNYDEFDSSKAKLPTLWGEFHGQNIAEHVPNKLNDSPIYGVYSEYESDASGQYTVTAGIAVNTTTSEYISTPVVGGQYMVFESDGEMPQAVIDGWSSVWKYFAKPQKYMRTFITDFEEYREPGRAAIFISVSEENV
jgi:predicted transcriptional regulator YdeE